MSNSASLLNVVFVDAPQKAREIDKSCRDKWKFEWMLEEDKNGDLFSSYIRKVDKPGMAWCLTCEKLIVYGQCGFKALMRHSGRICHTKKKNTLNATSSLGACFMSSKELNSCAKEDKKVKLPYGMPNPIINSVEKTLGVVGVGLESTNNSEVRVPVSFKDRKTHQEAMVLAYLAEQDLPLSKSSGIVELAQELARDPKALNELRLERSTATYKLKYGLSVTIKKRLLNAMRESPFSLNIDESTSKSSKKRILNILVCFFDDVKGEFSIYFDNFLL